MKKMILLTILMSAACACGTVRYQVKKPTDGRRVSTEIQWDIVEIKFNEGWKSILPEAWRQ